tara:strand:- start:17254 stop:18171 length:918 start_codon:yes stop_codon:yes gene_type:complete
MKITNKFGMPQPFVDFAINDKYSKGKADISVTSLIDSPRVRTMKDHYNDLIEVDAVDMVWALFGTAVHSVLESSNTYSRIGHPSDKIINEERLYSKVNGWTLSGAIDRQEINNDVLTIVDYKVTSAWSVIFGKPEWENQLNCYAYLCKQKYLNTNIKVGSLKICAILRDWNRREAERKEDYPQAPIVFVNITLWDDDKLDSYISRRISEHQDAQVNYDIDGSFPLCTNDERWRKKNSWAVKKVKLKRALKVFGDEASALIFQKEYQKHRLHENDRTEIEFRGGEYTRCQGNYCSVAEFCDQFNGE